MKALMAGIPFRLYIATEDVANDLAQQASGFLSNQGKFSFLEKSDVLVCQTGQSGFWPMCSVTICSTKPGLAKPDGPVSESGGSKISMTSDETSKTMTIGPDDWRTPLVCYLENLGHIADRIVWHQALKYVMLDNTLYH
jgi:hypothetical protein